MPTNVVMVDAMRLGSVTQAATAAFGYVGHCGDARGISTSLCATTEPRDTLAGTNACCT